MKGKQKAILVFAGMVLILLTAVLYPQFEKNAIEKRIYAYLIRNGYAADEIARIEARHSYIGGLLGYGQWHTSIFFADEPQVEYHCTLSNDFIPSILAITAGGFSPSLPMDYTPRHEENTPFHFSR